MSGIGRNERCPCGSGKKYKQCCLPKDQASLPAIPAKTPAAEEHFIAELRPEVDEAADQLLLRLERGEGEALRMDFETLLELNSDHHVPHYAMGVYVAMVERDPAGAIPYFERAVSLFPPMPEAHFNLGNAYMSAGEVSKAVGALRQTIRYASAGDGLEKLARDKLRDLEDVVRKYSPFQTLEVCLENQRLFEAAFENLTRGHNEKAIELFKQVLRQHPEHVQSYGNMGLAEANLGHKAAALACLDRAIELDPDYEPALCNRKVIERMEEGKPMVLDIVETDYYRERHEERNSRRASWWRGADAGVGGWL